jgi:Tfp pilus assembly protein PilX
MSPLDECASREHGSSRPRAGFALPLAIMVLALLTMGLVAGFAMSTSEQSATSSQRAQARAYSYAQMGLEIFLTKRKELGCTPSPTVGYTGVQASATGCAFCPYCWLVNASTPAGTVNANLDTLPTLPESVVVTFNSGKAVVKSRPVWLDKANGRGTYFVTSTGTDLQSTLATGLGRTTTASRTVGVYASWSRTTMNVLGALVSFSGIQKNGTGEISGVDQCGKAANVAGINVPLEASVSVSGNAFTPTGTPPYDTLQTFSQDSAATKMDWAGIKSGSSLQADITIPGGTFPAASTFLADTNYWPVIHVKSSPYTLPWKGRGMLIIDGDLTISGSDQWDGVILVGGKLTSNGDNVTSGTVMAGLNKLIGGTAGVVEEGDLNGTKSYMYNSCSVAKATSSMARYTMVPNTWMDDIAGY